MYKQSDIDYLDKVAFIALEALIAKSELVVSNQEGNQNVRLIHSQNANGAYGYAQAMLTARNRIIGNSEVKNLDVDAVVPEPVHDYKVEENANQFICTLHGRAVYMDTPLLGINHSEKETFEKDGYTIDLRTETFDRDNLLDGDPSDNGWDQFYIVKPALFLSGIPVYEDTVLETRLTPISSWSKNVVAGSIDPDFNDRTPIQVITSNGYGYGYGYYSEFYRVKE